MIYGIQYSTDSRDDGRETFTRFRDLHSAQAWKHEIGFGGVGPSFSSDNGHRYIRLLYQMPPGWRAPRGKRRKTEWSDLRADGERID